MFHYTSSSQRSMQAKNISRQSRSSLHQPIRAAPCCLSLCLLFTTVDHAGPVISGVPTSISQEATGVTTEVTWPDPTATDYKPLNPVVTCYPSSGSSFVLGVTTVTCNATDAAGHTTDTSFTVTVCEWCERSTGMQQVMDVSRFGSQSAKQNTMHCIHR